MQTELLRWNLDPATTLIRLMALNAQHRGNQVAVREKDFGIWQETTWQQWLDKVLSCAAGLEQLGFGRDSGLVVIGDNRLHLYTANLAAAALRGQAMPIFPDATPDEILHVIEQSKAAFVVAEDQEQVDKILDLRERCPFIKTIIYDDFRGLKDYKAPGLLSWHDLIERGALRLTQEKGLRELLLTSANPDDVAVIIHSSGTTGKPKGVLLTHRNVLSGVANAFHARPFG